MAALLELSVTMLPPTLGTGISGSMMTYSLLMAPSYFYSNALVLTFTRVCFLAVFVSLNGLRRGDILSAATSEEVCYDLFS